MIGVPVEDSVFELEKRAAAQDRIWRAVGRPGRVITNGPLRGFDDADQVLVGYLDSDALQRDMDMVCGKGPSGGPLARYAPNDYQWRRLNDLHDSHGWYVSAAAMRACLKHCRVTALVTIDDSRFDGIVNPVVQLAAAEFEHGRRYVDNDDGGGWLAEALIYCYRITGQKEEDFGLVRDILSTDFRFVGSLIALVFAIALREAKMRRMGHGRDVLTVDVEYDDTGRRVRLRR